MIGPNESRTGHYFKLLNQTAKHNSRFLLIFSSRTDLYLQLPQSRHQRHKNRFYHEYF